MSCSPGSRPQPYEALVLTVDAPCSGARDRSAAPAFAATRHFGGQSRRPAAPPAHRRQRAVRRPHGAAPDWDELAWLQQNTPFAYSAERHPPPRCRLAADAGVAG